MFQKFDEECEDIVWTCEQKCLKLTDPEVDPHFYFLGRRSHGQIWTILYFISLIPSQKQCYEEKKDEKSGATAVDHCNCPIMEPKQRTEPTFDPKSCPKGIVHYF